VAPGAARDHGNGSKYKYNVTIANGAVAAGRAQTVP
jgi:hypothetical protein